jgi:cysteinyl-tRNA synthetase
MALHLYNTRTRAVETFIPLRDGEVRVYVCGLTPSAEAHLGHARSFLFFDVLRRYLTHLGYKVTYVQNVTDIDDRSINRARETGEDWYKIVEGYYASFKVSMRKLDVHEPDEEPYATKYIPQIQEMIRELIANGNAYAVEDGIYYRVSSFPNYGKLSNRNIDELEAGARIEIGEHKDDPLDFALWKYAKPGEPKWPFEGFGDGRPGWHIECSAMAHTLLDPEGVGFDIHGGGADLIFPHHENEIAQSEPLMGHPPMARYWVHGGLLNFDGRKMSKSLGNFEPLSDLLQRLDPQAIRLAFLFTGYSKVMNFTDESIRAATTGLDKLKSTWRKLYVAAGQPSLAPERPAGDRAQLFGWLEDALNDDMNTAAVVAQLFNVEHLLPHGDDVLRFQIFNYALYLLGLEANESWTHEPQATLAPNFLDRLREELDGTIALNGAGAEEAIERVIAKRQEARANKDWALSDRLRDILARCGVSIKDSKEGTTWTVVR